ncbi:hypothetical protein LUA77_03355 [Helicobacter pylori]|nr:hypothetical protein LUA77_03355 [Helicobacter pylori]
MIQIIKKIPTKEKEVDKNFTSNLRKNCAGCEKAALKVIKNGALGMIEETQRRFLTKLVDHYETHEKRQLEEAHEKIRIHL